MQTKPSIPSLADRQREALIERHRPLAISLARRFAAKASWGESVEDLTQVAMIGLLGATGRYDPSRGVPFAAFASATIVGELKHYLRDRSWTVRPPRRVQDLYLRLQGAASELAQELGRAPTPAEVAERVDASIDEVAEALEVAAMRRPTSLDSPFGGGDEQQPLWGCIAADDHDLEAVDERMAVSCLLAQLPERQQRMVRLRFIDGLTQHEIAKKMSMSQAHVQRLLTRSIDQLRALAIAS